MSIQDESNMKLTRSMEEAYQYDLRVEKKMTKKQESNSRGRRRSSKGKAQFSNDKRHVNKSKSSTLQNENFNQDTSGCGNFLRKRIIPKRKR